MTFPFLIQDKLPEVLPIKKPTSCAGILFSPTGELLKPPLGKSDEKLTSAHHRRKKRKDDSHLSGDNRFSGIGPVLKMTQSVYLAILSDLVEEPFYREKAGMLLGPTEEDDLVTHYVADENGRATYSSFTLDAIGLNETLRQRKDVGLNCKGVVHVHPPGVLQPSLGDLEYVAKLFANPKNSEATQVMLPIVCNGRLYPYLIDANRPREILVPRLILV